MQRSGMKFGWKDKKKWFHEIFMRWNIYWKSKGWHSFFSLFLKATTAQYNWPGISICFLSSKLKIMEFWGKVWSGVNGECRATQFYDDLIKIIKVFISCSFIRIKILLTLLFEEQKIGGNIKVLLKSNFQKNRR